MTTIQRTTSQNTDFVKLVTLLDQYLGEKDGEEHSFYAQFNSIDKLNHVIVVYQNKHPVGCGAIKRYNDFTAEVKRMYVLPEVRGMGIATQILQELEKWARELLFSRCILETGKRQPEAIALYMKTGYKVIPNYGQYEGVENSVCFEKDL